MSTRLDTRIAKLEAALSADEDPEFIKALEKAEERVRRMREQLGLPPQRDLPPLQLDPAQRNDPVAVLNAAAERAKAMAKAGRDDGTTY